MAATRHKPLPQPPLFHHPKEEKLTGSMIDNRHLKLLKLGSHKGDRILRIELIINHAGVRGEVLCGKIHIHFILELVQEAQEGPLRPT